MSPAPRPLPPQGIALTVGLAAARHLDHVWAVLEQFGRSTPIRWSLNSFSPKVLALWRPEAWTADRDAGPPWGGGSWGRLGGKAVGHGPRPPPTSAAAVWLLRRTFPLLDGDPSFPPGCREPSCEANTGQLPRGCLPAAW